LSWQAAATGEQTASFNLYLATEACSATSGLTPIQLHAASTFYTDVPAADGTYFYAVTGLDPSFNESGISNVLAAQSLHTGPAAPPGLEAVFSAAQKRISLASTASTGTAVSYNVYRATFSAPGVAGRAALLTGATTTAFVDAPSTALDSTYYYLVTAVDLVGNEGAPSNQSAVVFDVHAPAITVTRVTNGQYSNRDLTPSISITDFSSFLSTTTLNGQPFVSTVAIYGTFNQTVGEGGTASLSCSIGTIQSYTSVWATSCGNPKNCGSCPIDGTSCTVVFDNAHCGDAAPGCSKDGRLAINCGVPGITLTLPGAYFLSVAAQDTFGSSSTATAFFTIDKTSPTIAIFSPPNGLITNQDVLVAFQAADDLTSEMQLVVKDEFGSVVAPSYTIAAEGARLLRLTARDLAGNAASASAVFILDKTPPAAVADLRVTAKDPAAAQATLAWTSPHDAL
ncbi:MAG: hypothetical protein AAB262_02350, partial [Elusimicrobiota bacterium]